MTRPLGLAVVLAALLAPTGAQARLQTVKKGMWGPAFVNGASQFPIYRRLGVGLYATRLRWNRIALSRPARPADPDDPAYAWPADIGAAVEGARQAHMKVAMEVQAAPAWSNGGRPSNVPPDDPRDFARFLAAASKRYPGVNYWQIWAEPTRAANFALIPQKSPTTPLDAVRRKPVQTYARLLDAAYGALKHVDKRDKVVGGNTFVAGDISPLNFIRALKLPSGRPPRMDLYSHHPFTARRPDLSGHEISPGLADFSDLDLVARWVDRYLGKGPDGKPLKLYLGEFTLATDHANHNLSVWVSRETQASWLRSALRIVRRWKRIETMVYFELYDEPPAADGYESDWGLLDWRGARKPAFAAFAHG